MSKKHPAVPLKDSVVQDPWESLRAYTTARIALGKTGTAVPLKETLRFRLAHAHARDAVYSSLETERLHAELQRFGIPVCGLRSMAHDRQEYLQRPDLGRKLDDVSRDQLATLASGKQDVAFILADGLSAEAINVHAIPLLQYVIPFVKKDFSIAPLTLVQQGRVAISDEIGDLLQARLAVIFIGERPGLSSPDSLGIYLTYDPRPGKTDESRNCISNVRPGGLSCKAAAEKLLYFIHELSRLKLSGVGVKDRSGEGRLH